MKYDLICVLTVGDGIRTNGTGNVQIILKIIYRESMLDTHDTESVEEDEMISSIDSVIDRTSNEVAIELF